MLKRVPRRLGFLYRHGKVLIYTAGNNPEPMADKPSWAVDIREILAMLFVGVGAICLIYQGDVEGAKMLLIGLFGYATGRTIPGGKQ